MVKIQYEYTVTAQIYNELREGAGWRRLTDKQAERGIANSTFVVAAKCGNEVIGMGRVLFDFGYTAYIADLIICPDYQGKGIGKKIVELLMQKVEEAAEPGDGIMFVLVAASEKEGFYEKLGFQRRPTEELGAGMSKWVDVK